MANLNLLDAKIPITQKSYWTPTEAAKIKAQMNTINAKYGKYINQAAAASNVNPEIITSFIAIESGGDQNAVNGRTVGLMQLDPASASDILAMENIKKRLTPTEKAILKKKLGKRLDQICRMRFLGDVVDGKITFVTAADLKDPEFNIAVGTIYLGLLIDEEEENKQIRFDRVVMRYNKGYFNKPDKKKSIEQNIADSNNTTRSYILKFGGVNGTMDLLT